MDGESRVRAGLGGSEPGSEAQLQYTQIHSDIRVAELLQVRASGEAHGVFCHLGPLLSPNLILPCPLKVYMYQTSLLVTLTEAHHPLLLVLLLLRKSFSSLPSLPSSPTLQGPRPCLPHEISPGTVSHCSPCPLEF